MKDTKKSSFQALNVPLSVDQKITQIPIIIKLDFNLPMEDVQDFKADMIINLKDLVSGNYKVPEKLKQKLGVIKEKKARTKKTNTTSKIAKMESLTINNDPYANVELSKAPDHSKVHGELVSQLMKEELEAEGLNPMDVFLSANKTKVQDSDDNSAGSLNNFDSFF